MDCEFTTGEGLADSKVALWQVATREKVFLIDMVAILSDPHKFTELWSNFFRSITIDPTGNDIKVILGYDFGNDLKTLASTSPVFSDLKGILKNVILDIKIFSECLLSEVFSDCLYSESFVNLLKKSKQRGLSGL